MSLNYNYVSSLRRESTAAVAGVLARPQLSIGFTGNTLDNRLTFTRSTAGNYFDSTGTLQTAAVNVPRFDYDPNTYSVQNLTIHSQDFTNTSWTKQSNVQITSTTALAPDNTLTATVINWASTPNQQGIFQSGVTVRGDATNTKSIYVRADVAGGTVELADPSNTIGTPSFTLTTNWQRITLTETQTGGSSGIWLRRTASSPATVYVWGGQVNIGSTALPYYRTTTSTYNLCNVRGLLVEETATNPIRNNTMVGAVAGTPGTAPTNWFVSLNSITGVTTSIIGTGTERGVTYVDVRLNGTPSGTAPQGIQIGFDSSNVITAASGQVWTLSSWVRIVGGTTTNITGFVFNIQEYQTTTFLQSNTTSFTPTTTLLRYAATSTLSNALTTSILPLIGVGVTASAAIDITLRIGLPQVEQGTRASSVILTSSGSVTRQFDNLDMTSIGSWFNSTEGTLYGESLLDRILPTSGTGTFPGVFHIADGTFNNRIVLTAFSPGATNNYYGTVITGGVDQGSLGTNAFAANTIVRGAYAYKVNDAAFSANGSTAVVDTTVTLPTGLNIANFGGTLSAGANRLNGWLRNIKYYNTRLSNANLQKLTT